MTLRKRHTADRVLTFLCKQDARPWPEPEGLHGRIPSIIGEDFLQFPGHVLFPNGDKRRFHHLSFRALLQALIPCSHEAHRMLFQTLGQAFFYCHHPAGAEPINSRSPCRRLTSSSSKNNSTVMGNICRNANINAKWKTDQCTQKEREGAT